MVYHIFFLLFQINNNFTQNNYQTYLLIESFNEVCKGSILFHLVASRYCLLVDLFYVLFKYLIYKINVKCVTRKFAILYYCYISCFT